MAEVQCGIHPMTQNAAVLLAGNGKALGIITWAEGLRRFARPAHRLSEDDLMAKLMYLSRHGQSDLADELLERWVEGRL
jgi:hypothetical protein